ncbi:MULTISPECIES: site-specific DNA-methyltransferase [unclassified Acinetobacter]|uniref:DNA-methyltransferase n=1 Tax=unclassified Acinetobacter TaxID=196816 RepID=UPI00124D4694|nr:MULTISPECIES: site-specific DNA-methyltransferase [unclassified Acinetobacter]
MTQPFNLYHGDCLTVLKELTDNSIDSIVTDPPYGLKFMGKKWDCEVPSVEIWIECLRVLKPGGHLLAFAGTRTHHRMACNIEDAGFEIRDMIAWIYGSGFPKSHNLDDEWKGWGTALKPALEPITFARKPIIGTVAQNMQMHGTGAININECRISLNGGYKSKANGRPSQTGQSDNYNSANANQPDTLGRWPANLIHDGSEEVIDNFPVTSSGSNNKIKESSKAKNGNTSTAFGAESRPYGMETISYGDTGSAARFFYCAKASRTDRNEGVNSSNDPVLQMNSTMRDCENADWSKRNGNFHPTVKPTDLMRYLCRLVTPKAGVVLDPFMGSGSTGKAAILEGFTFIGIEREAEYFEIAKARCEFVEKSVGTKMPDQQDLFMETN